MFAKRTSTSLLAAALGTSAGVMIYVSFGEILTKSTGAFQAHLAASQNLPADDEGVVSEAARYTAFSFFLGMILTGLLNGAVHFIGQPKLLMDGGATGEDATAAAQEAADALAHADAGTTGDAADNGGCSPATQLSTRSDSTGSSTPSVLQATNPEAAATTTAAQVAAEGSYDAASDAQPPEGVAAAQVQLVSVAVLGDSTDEDEDDDQATAAATATATATAAVTRYNSAGNDDANSPNTPHGFVEVRLDSPRVGLQHCSGDMAVMPNVATDKRLKNMGIMAALAIGLHNLPEGLATFVGTLASPTLGVTLAMAIAIHNIPEGLCVALPIYYSTGSRAKGFLWCTVSAIAEPVGGAIGLIVLRASADANGDMPNLVYGLLFGVVSGMMVYISMREMLPTAMRYDPKNKWTMPFCFLGMAVMAASLLLFAV